MGRRQGKWAGGLGREHSITHNNLDLDSILHLIEYKSSILV